MQEKTDLINIIPNDIIRCFIQNKIKNKIDEKTYKALLPLKNYEFIIYIALNGYLDGHFYTYREIADILSISEEKIKRIQNNTRIIVHNRTKTKIIKDFLD